MNLHLLPVFCYLATALCAQKVPVPKSSGRELQLFDVADLLLEPTRGPNLLQPGLPGASSLGPTSPSPMAALCTFLRHFLVPPLGEGDDLQPLAGRLAMVARPDELAKLESLLATNRARQGDRIQVEVRLVRFSREDFEADLRGKLVATERDKDTVHEQVFPASEARALLDAALAKGRETIDCPSLIAKPLHLCTMSSLTQTAYVRDFSLQKKGDATIAEPIVDTVWSGFHLDLIAGFEADGTIVVSSHIQSQELVRPIATVDIDLGLGNGQPAKLQLPRTLGVRMRQIAHVHAGDLVVIAAPQATGDYLVAFVQTTLAANPK